MIINIALLIIVLFLAYLLYVQKKNVESLQPQTNDLRNKIDILEEQKHAASQSKDFLRQETNMIHLEAVFSLEEIQKTSI